MFVRYLWLIPVLPLLAAGVSALLPQRARGGAATLAIGSMVLAFFLSCAALLPTLSGQGEAARFVFRFDWFSLGEGTVRLGWVLDPLTASMLVMITFVGTLIFIYSVGYMARDENFTRFFCFLSLFAAAMLGLVIADSLLMFFMCWELVGLASYLLIGFWYHKPSAAAAAKKAFITTRVGDIFFFLGLVWLYAETGTLLFYDDGRGCLEAAALTKLAGQLTGLGVGVATVIALLVFCGAIGKSGQLPLHVWLPDAMEGPTPVSALIHAATMVAAGVFLVARVYPLMATVPAAAPALVSAAVLAGNEEAVATADANPTTNQQAQHTTEPHSMAGAAPEPELGKVSTALKVVTWIGVLTAVFAALIAVAQTDIKRILAYSTISQLGFMFFGLGVGGVAVGMFHLLAHAFFKALLFLGAGSVIHGCHEEQDIRRMGEVRKWMPVTFVTYAVGMLALAGFPLLFSGFWSKDEILHTAWLWQPSRWPFALGLFGAFLTAFYMARQMWFVFFGHAATPSMDFASETASADPKSVGLPGVSSHPPSPAHESPPVMTIPLGLLAGGTILLTAFGTPAWPWFHSYLSGHGANPAISGSVAVGVLGIMLVSSLIGLGGIGLGAWLYSRHGPRRADDPDPLEVAQPEIYTVLRNKFYVDELYQHSVVIWNERCSRAARWLDDAVWSRAVQGIGLMVTGFSWLSRLVDEFVVNLGFDQGCGGVRLGARLLSWCQNGRIQRYLRVVGIALALGGAIFIWSGRSW